MWSICIYKFTWSPNCLRFSLETFSCTALFSKKFKYICTQNFLGNSDSRPVLLQAAWATNNPGADEQLSGTPATVEKQLGLRRHSILMLLSIYMCLDSYIDNPCNMQRPEFLQGPRSI